MNACCMTWDHPHKYLKPQNVPVFLMTPTFFPLGFDNRHRLHNFYSSPEELFWAFQVALVVKNPPANAGGTGSIPASGRSPGGEHGNLLQYSCL